jgi:hypothetical protein
MRAWRIATDTRFYQADDMTGIGAKNSGGRWNSEGNAIVIRLVLGRWRAWKPLCTWAVVGCL